MMKPPPKALAVLAVVMLALPGCIPEMGGDIASLQAPAEYREFGTPERVTIRGYDNDAMEPFISKDGRFLFFNNRNGPHTNTNLHYAERIDDLTFEYRNEMKGINTPVLESVPSVDKDGNLYFISMRSYNTTLSTLYRGRFNDNGTVTGIEPVGGVSMRQRGIMISDAEISADGNTLMLVDSRLSGTALPRTADIAIATRDGKGFRRLSSSEALMANVNTDALEYAPAISADLLELFFTRTDVSGTTSPIIYRAVRANPLEPFGMPERVAAITGYAEAPSLTANGRAMYFHKLDGNRFAIYRTER